MNILEVIHIPTKRSKKVQDKVKNIFTDHRGNPDGMKYALKDIMGSFGIRSMNEQEKFLIGIYVGKLLHNNETLAAARELQTPQGIKKVFASFGMDPKDMLNPTNLKKKIKDLGY